MQIVLYSRVSTKNQEYDRQEEELRAYAKEQGWEVKSAFSEKISGARTNTERPGLMKMLEYVKKHKVDKVLVTELSRLGRSTVQVLDFIEQLKDRKVSVYIKNLNLETLMPDGKENAVSSLVFTIVAELAKMERMNIRERMESGYKHFRAQGGKVGRKSTYRKTDAEILKQYAMEAKLIRQGAALRDISVLTGHCVNTIRKIKKIVVKSDNPE